MAFSHEPLTIGQSDKIMEQVLKAALEKSTATGAGIENARICIIIADRIIEAESLEVKLELTRLLNQLQ